MTTTSAIGLSLELKTRPVTIDFLDNLRLLSFSRTFSTLQHNQPWRLVMLHDDELTEAERFRLEKELAKAIEEKRQAEDELKALKAKYEANLALLRAIESYSSHLK